MRRLARLSALALISALGCGRVRYVPLDASTDVAIDTGRGDGVATRVVELATPQAGSRFGGEVAGAGDVDHDGYDDVIVGAYQWDGEAVDEGRAYLFYGGPDGLSGRVWSADPTNQAGAQFGVSVAGVGDVNGDTFDDVIVGAEGWDGTFMNQGRAYLYMGGMSGLSTTAIEFSSADRVNAAFGGSVAGAGDVNGDRIADVVIGARYFNGEEIAEGRAYLFLGRAGDGLNLVPSWFADPTDQRGAAFATALESAGDLNGDHLDDVIVGAYEWSGEAMGEGRVYIYVANGDGTLRSAGTADPLDQVESRFGGAVSGAGDVDGDGRDDVVIGAWAYDRTSMNEGVAFVYRRSPMGGLSSSDRLTLVSPGGAMAAFGYDVSGAGDFNHDSYGDVIVSGFGIGNSGASYIYMGGPEGLNPTARWTLTPTTQNNAQTGISVASAGDVNRDGFDDVVVGAFLWDGSAGADEGRADVFYGRP